MRPVDGDYPCGSGYLNLFVRYPEKLKVNRWEYIGIIVPRTPKKVEGYLFYE